MNNDEQFQQSITDKLKRQPLDKTIQSRLRQARISALDADQRAISRGWLPATALAGFLLLALTLLLDRNDSDELLLLEQGDDLAIIGSEDSLEMYQELEFYVWLGQDQPV